MAKDNVVPFTGITTQDIDPAMTLHFASEHAFQRVIVIGVLENGEEYVSCSCADGGAFLWDVERAKLNLLRMADDDKQ